jgi:uncharacterized protein (DUF169 family)
MTMDFRTIEQTLRATLGDLRPVCVAYLATAPEGVVRFEGTRPSGCSFWKLAAEGRSFVTVPSDHFGCPIGSYTHAIDLPPERGAELEQTLALMAGIGYVKMTEVPSIPRLSETPAYVYYAPLAETAVPPDVVIFAGSPGRLMLLQEAAARANATSSLPLLGRPTCMGLPAAIAQGAVMSLGCIGNRVYTDLGEGELYLMVPGRRLDDVVEELATIASANTTLAEHHRQRRQNLTV